MLEVVEEEQGPGFVEAVGHRFDRAAPARLARADRAGDRARDELRIGDGCEADEMDGAVERGSCCYLERESTLSGAARACDRDEADPRLEQPFGARQSLGTADEPVMQCGKARCSTAS